jgi:hypothetical protein
MTLVPLLVFAAASTLLAACGDDDGSSGSGGAATERSIPTRVPAPPTPLPVVTVPGGAPEVTEFAAPRSFSCLAESPEQAQVTIGWNVPSATDVAVQLDGSVPASGIQDALPYQVPAGPAVGPGVAMVFPCDLAEHTITLTWTAGSSPPTERVVAITKAARP